jgi:hypothetical protein
MPKEGDGAYDQQCDVILKPKHLWFQALLVPPNDKSLLCWIRENWKMINFFTNIKGQLKNQNEIQTLSNDHDRFKLQNGLLYHDGILYVLNDHVWLQTLQAKHDFFGYKSFSIQQGHGINVSKLLVATTLEVCEGVCWIVWYLLINKKWWSSPTCVYLLNVNPYIIMVFNSMGFITNLSCSNSYNSILMVVDHLINNHPSYFLIMFSNVMASLYHGP